jgi:hypothetical protein
MKTLDPYDYRQIIKAINEAFDQCPITYLPALFLHVTEKCIEKKVWKNLKVMHRVVDDIAAKKHRG